jgi:integrase
LLAALSSWQLLNRTSDRLGHASIGITLDTYSHVLPGLQEAAAEKFEMMFETDTNEDLDADVSKMLADGEQSKSEPGGIRTRDTVIKRYKRMVTDGEP